MTDQLKTYCKTLVKLTEEDLSLIDEYFEPRKFKRKEYLLEEGKVCDFIAFICEGTVRHFYTKDGEERTCDISFEDTFITEFDSFNHQTKSSLSLQALTDTTVLLVQKENLTQLYRACSQFETVGRLMAEKVAQRASRIAMSLASDKPETRYVNLLKNQPGFLQRVQQKYIANYLGISPESLSRIRKRISQEGKS